MIEQEWIEACYRAILGRDPENEEVVRSRQKRIESPQDLLAEFMGSEEFARRLPSLSIGANYRYAPPRIEVDAPSEKLGQLFERHRLQWRALGEKEPFWSVLSHDEFKSVNITNERLDAFYASGKDDADLIDLFAHRTNTRPERGLCLELGCGVGRVTKYLAARFDHVLAVDVSEGNLQHGRQMAAHFGLSNVEFKLIRSPAEISGLPSPDFFFSMIVLQHNCPPVQRFLLDCILGKIKPGGGFLFQTQTYTPGYRFDVDEFLSSPIGDMDMHCLPMHEIFRLIEKHHLSIREVLMDMWTGFYGSHTFFGVKSCRRYFSFRRKLARAV